MPESNPNLQPLFDKLTENMQIIYRKAIDADQSLARLQQSGKGKFNHVFTDEAGFTVQSKRFMPYVEELATQVAQLHNASAEQVEAQLADIVRKMELMLITLGQFKHTL